MTWPCANPDHGKNEVWTTQVPPKATSKETAIIQRGNLQAIRDSRKRAKKAAETGVPVPLSLHARAADAGASSCRGGLFLGGDDGTENRRRAQNTFSKTVCRAEQSASEREEANKERRANGNFQLALHVMKSDGDDEIVVNYLKAAARDGHVEAMWRLGCAYEKGQLGLLKDEKTALGMYRSAADGGSAPAQFVLGVANEFGQLGLVKDEKTALGMYRSAVDGGDEDAHFSLGVASEFGQLGLEKDEKTAFEMYRKAADGGSARAHLALGLAYEDGRLGLEKDEKNALGMYRSAADGGDQDAQFFLGDAYEFGRLGLEKDEKTALEMYRKAADGGDQDAQRALGRLENRGCVF